MKQLSMYFEDDEPVRWRKRSQSGRSHSASKANHRHEYRDCMFIDYEGHVFKGNYCTQCGKIGIMVTPLDNDGYVMRRDDALKEYADLPVHRIGDVWEKYVVLNHGDS